VIFLFHLRVRQVNFKLLVPFLLRIRDKGRLLLPLFSYPLVLLSVLFFSTLREGEEVLTAFLPFLPFSFTVEKNWTTALPFFFLL